MEFQEKCLTEPHAAVPDERPEAGMCNVCITSACLPGGGELVEKQTAEDIVCDESTPLAEVRLVAEAKDNWEKCSLLKENLNSIFDAHFERSTASLREMLPVVASDLGTVFNEQLSGQALMLKKVFVGEEMPFFEATETPKPKPKKQATFSEADLVLKGEHDFPHELDDVILEEEEEQPKAMRSRSGISDKSDRSRPSDASDWSASQMTGSSSLFNFGRFKSVISDQNASDMKKVAKWLQRQFTKLPSFEKKSRRQSRVGAIVHSKTFATLTAICVVANSVFIGVDVNLRVDNELERLLKGDGLKTESVVSGWWVMRHVFNLIFVIEVIMRFLDPRTYLLGKNQMWNAFDLILVLVPTLWLINPFTDRNFKERLDSMPSISFFRIIRAFRLIQELQIFRFPMVSELRLISKATINSMHSFIWATGIGVFWLYIFGVGFMLGVGKYLQGIDSKDDLKMILIPAIDGMVTDKTALEAVFKKLDGTFRYLFMAVTGGVDWSETFYPTTLLLPAEYRFFLLFFILFVNFALVNIICGMFIERAFKAVTNDRDFGILEETKDNYEYSDRIKGLFHELDMDRSGQVSWDEIQHHLDNPHVKAYFAWLGINISQAGVVFDLMDRNGDGELKISEFLSGCHSLRGQATNVEAKVLHYEIKEENKWLEQLLKKLEAHKVRKSKGRRSSQVVRLKGAEKHGSMARQASRHGSRRAARR